MRDKLHAFFVHVPKPGHILILEYYIYLVLKGMNANQINQDF